MVAVVGRLFQKWFPAQPNLSYTFIWDKTDAYGQRVYGLSEAVGELDNNKLLEMAAVVSLCQWGQVRSEEKTLGLCERWSCQSGDTHSSNYPWSDLILRIGIGPGFRMLTYDQWSRDLHWNMLTWSESNHSSNVHWKKKQQLAQDQSRF